MTESIDKESTVEAKIVIIDDHPLVRQGLAQTIEDHENWRVVGEADGINQAMELMKKEQPDLAIVDITLGDESGLDLIRRMGIELPKIKALVVSMHDEKLYAERALRTGAQGYINKSSPGPELIVAMEKVLAGKTALSAAMTERLVRRSVGGSTGKISGVEALSDRELQVFQMVGLGKSTREIADKLCLSAKTVETHRQNIKAKLKLNSGTELMRQATIWVEGEGSA